MPKLCISLIVTVVFAWTMAKLQAQPLSLISSFEGGNVEWIRYDSIRRQLWVTPSLKPGDTQRVWFYFGATNIPDKGLNLYVRPAHKKAYQIGDEIVYSHDRVQWHRLRADSVNEKEAAKIFSLPASPDTLYIAAGYPYTHSHLVGFLRRLPDKKFVRVSVMCQSERGLDVPLLKIGKATSKPKPAIWVTARQHAFESPSSYVAEGLINFLVSRDKQARALRKRYDVFIVPMVDVDKVYQGGTGKDQIPADFNRDWGTNPHWNVIKTLKQVFVEQQKLQPMRLFIDLHSPFPVDKKFSHYYNEYPTDDKRYINLEAFMASYGQRVQRRLPTNQNNRILSGQITLRNYIDALYAGQTSFLFATTYEQAWEAAPSGPPFSEATLINNGEQLGRSMFDLLKP